MRPAVALYPCSSYGKTDLGPVFDDIFESFSALLPHHGAKVLLKPNMVKALPRESCGQTDPDFLVELIDRGLELGWKISVGDSPAIGSVRQTTKANGLWEALQKRSIPLVQLSGNEERFSRGRSCFLAKQLNDFDQVINVPKLKGHGQLYYTGAIKNLFGCVGGKRKVWLHMKLGDDNGGRDFAEMLVDHALAVKPSLTIIDGIRAMAGRGPIHGHPVHEGLVGVGACPFALDQVVFDHLDGDVTKDPVMTHLKETELIKVAAEMTFPLGKPDRGDFYFPKDDERKPISFHPWVLTRLAWRDVLSKWSS
jgi:uncharacterized protein (DUF362 family)